MEDNSSSLSDNSKARDDREDIIEDKFYSNNLYKYETQKKEKKGKLYKNELVNKLIEYNTSDKTENKNSGQEKDDEDESDSLIDDNKINFYDVQKNNIINYLTPIKVNNINYNKRRKKTKTENISNNNENNDEDNNDLSDLFSNSSTDNKNVMVSELDIELSNSQSNYHLNTDIKWNNINMVKKREIDFKKEIEQNLKKFLKKNQEMMKSNNGNKSNNKNNHINVNVNNSLSNNVIKKEIKMKLKDKIKLKIERFKNQSNKMNYCLTDMNKKIHKKSNNINVNLNNSVSNNVIKKEIRMKLKDKIKLKMNRFKKQPNKINYCLTDLNKKLYKKSNNINNNSNHNTCLHNNNNKISSFIMVKNKMNYEISHHNNSNFNSSFKKQNEHSSSKNHIQKKFNEIIKINIPQKKSITNVNKIMVSTKKKTNINLNKKQKTMNLPNIYEIKSKILYLQNKNKKKGKEKLLKKNDLSEYIISNRNNDKVKTTVCINNYGFNNMHDAKDLKVEGYYNNSEKKHVTEKINKKSGMKLIMSSNNKNLCRKNDSMNNMIGINNIFNGKKKFIRPRKEKRKTEVCSSNIKKNLCEFKFIHINQIAQEIN